MSTHNICFYGELEKIITKYSFFNNNSSVHHCNLIRAQCEILQFFFNKQEKPDQAVAQDLKMAFLFAHVFI